jgi:hypothetical protein
VISAAVADVAIKRVAARHIVYFRDGFIASSQADAVDQVPGSVGARCRGRILCDPDCILIPSKTVTTLTATRSTLAGHEAQMVAV